MKNTTMQKRKSKVGNRKAGSRSQKNMIERMEHPPQINGYEITHKKRLRFTVLAGVVNSAISFADLLDLIVLSTTAIQGYDVFDVVKVQSIEVWGQAALGTPNTITVYFTTSTGDRSVHTDTSLGVKPAYVKAVPSQKSLASFWQSSAAGNCFSITVPAGSVIDLNLSFKTAEFTAPQGTQNALVGATVGDIYYRGMDAANSASTNFPPIIGVNTN
jgi:hypothetical protein